MNCKPGDLAVVVSSVRSESVGKVLTVVRLATTAEIESEIPGALQIGPIWRTDRPMGWIKRTGEESTAFLAPDCRLRPIRDNDGEDETLTWSGKPTKEHAPKEVQSL